MREQQSQLWPRKVIFRLALAMALVAVTVCYMNSRKESLDQYDITVVPPKCEESGYSFYKHKVTEHTEIRDLVEATGHTYGSPKFWQAEGVLAPEITVRICEVCGKEDRQAKYPDVGLTQVILQGDLTGISKYEEARMRASIFGQEAQLECYALLKYQGHSSLNYDKKNYTLKLYEDAEYSQKNKLELLHWNKEHKYILKANYADPSQCHNLVSADIWADMVSSRENVPAELQELSNFGAVDGFPVVLYINETFQGIYTFNIHKDDDLFGMEDDHLQTMMIVNHTDGAEAYFQELPAFGEETPWEVEFCGTEDSDWAKKHLLDVIRFVMESDDESFRNDLDQYLDVDSAIDYLLAMYALSLTEHAAKDLLLVSYGPSDPWICSMYDMEEAFDGWEAVPVFADGSWDSGTESLLWDRILNQFYPELCERYAQLRQSILNPDDLCARVEAFTRKIPQTVYQADAQVNGTKEHTPQDTQEMMEVIRQQIAAMDKVFLKEGE